MSGKSDHAAQKNSRWITELVQELRAAGFYGKIVLSFESGVVRHVEKKETFLPPG